jgi:membrane protease YdiL (CAAX protease family)
MRIARFLALLAGGWIAAWLIPGLWLGQPDLLLTRQAPAGPKMGYHVALYFWLVIATVVAWRRWGPDPRTAASLALRPGWSGSLGIGLGLGLGMIVISRLIWAFFGHWGPGMLHLDRIAMALLAAPLAALVEEAVFRGYLFQVARESYGRLPAYLGVNAFFALLHLFRPGTLTYKLWLGLALTLAGILLCLVMEASGSLWLPVGVHTVWIFQQIVDPPGQGHPSWWWGMDGDPLGGALSVLLMGLNCLGLLGYARRSWSSPECSSSARAACAAAASSSR